MVICQWHMILLTNRHLQLLRTTLEGGTAPCHMGVAHPAEAALPSAHVHRVILPRVQPLLSSAGGLDSSSSVPSLPLGS